MKKVVLAALCIVLTLLMPLCVTARDQQVTENTLMQMDAENHLNNFEKKPNSTLINFKDLTKKSVAKDNNGNHDIYSGLLLYDNDLSNEISINYNSSQSVYYVDISKIDEPTFYVDLDFIFENIDFTPTLKFRIIDIYGIKFCSENELKTKTDYYLNEVWNYVGENDSSLKSVYFWIKNYNDNENDYNEEIAEEESKATPIKDCYAEIEFYDVNNVKRTVIIYGDPKFISKRSSDTSNPQPTENDTNTLPTREKLEAAQKDGKGFVPVKVYNSANAIHVDTMSYIGKLSDKVGLEVTNGDATFRFTGGFKVNEPGRIYYPLAYEQNSIYEADILKYFAKKDAKTDTCKLGGEYTLPKAATITVKTALPEGSEAYIYNYVAEPFPGKATIVGKAKVVNGRLTFDAKTLGEFIFTTEKIG